MPSDYVFSIRTTGYAMLFFLRRYFIAGLYFLVFVFISSSPMFATGSSEINLSNAPGVMPYYGNESDVGVTKTYEYILYGNDYRSRSSVITYLSGFPVMNVLSYDANFKDWKAVEMTRGSSQAAVGVVDVPFLVYVDFMKINGRDPEFRLTAFHYSSAEREFLTDQNLKIKQNSFRVSVPGSGGGVPNYVGIIDPSPPYHVKHSTPGFYMFSNAENDKLALGMFFCNNAITWFGENGGGISDGFCGYMRVAIAIDNTGPNLPNRPPDLLSTEGLEYKKKEDGILYIRNLIVNGQMKQLSVSHFGYNDITDTGGTFRPSWLPDNPGNTGTIPSSGIDRVRVFISNDDGLSTEMGVWEWDANSPPYWNPNTALNGSLVTGNGIRKVSVIAYDKAGNRTQSEENLEIFLDNVGPKPPSPLQYNRNGQNVEFILPVVPADLPVDNGIGTSADKHDIYIYKNGSIINTICDQRSPSFEFSEDGTYTAEIRYYDELGNAGSFSEPVVIVIDTTPPPKPNLSISGKGSYMLGGIFYAIPGTHQSLHWECSGIAGVTDFSHYTLEAEIDKGNSWDIIRNNIIDTSAEITITDLTLYRQESNGNRYYRFRVSSVDKYGNKAQSEPVIIRSLPDLSSPAFPNNWFSHDAEDGSYTLDWDPVSWIDPGKNISYQVFFCAQDDIPVPVEDGGNLTAFLEQNFTTIEDTSLEIFSFPPDWTNTYVAFVRAFVYLSDSEGINFSHYSAIDSMTVTLQVEPGEKLPPCEVAKDEIWDEGVHDIDRSWIIPDGFTLTIRAGAEIRLSRSDTAIIIEEGGSLLIEGAPDRPVRLYRHPDETGSYSWYGIVVKGSADVEHAVLSNAVRAMIIQNSANVVINKSVFAHNSVGIHAIYTENRPCVSECEFRNNRLYGVKEDNLSEDGIPRMTENEFINNGRHYYHYNELVISMDRLNFITGNSGNYIGEE